MELVAEPDRNRWADLLSEGRLPRLVLVILGVWLTAVDSLVTATIMPSVGAEIGGYAYFGWAVAGFLIGVVLASASSGRLSEIFGLRVAMSGAALVFAAGCILSAAAPGMGTFLTGRFLQGIGSGWIAGFAMVAVAVLFPQRHLARVFASVTAVWGIATVLGPLVGGVFSGAGNWRAVFWLFALQAVLFAAASAWLLRGTVRSEGTSGIPWPQLATLGLAVGAIGAANVVESAAATVCLVVAGMGILGLLVLLDRGASVRLLPKDGANLGAIAGAGYATMFALTASSMGLLAYGPAILQELHGLAPLWAGYVVAAQALAWTIAAFAVAGASEEGERRWIRLGAACILIGAALLAVLMRGASLAGIIFAAAIMGVGFGFSSSLMNRRVLGVLPAGEKAIGSSALIAARQTGGAVGAAVAGAAANLGGFGTGLSTQTAQTAAVWVFITAIPFAFAGVLGAWRMTGVATSASNSP